MHDSIRYSLCLAGIVLFSLVLASKLEILRVGFFDSHILLAVAVVIFLLGYFSPKHGFGGSKNDSGSADDPTPGLGARKRGLFGDGPFDGGGGGGGD